MKSLTRLIALVLIAAMIVEPASAAGFAGLIPSGTFSIPSKFGQISGISLRDSAWLPDYIVIQDLHAHAEAQQNIAGIISYLYKKLNVRNILVEGAFSKVDVSVLRSLPQAERETTVDGLLRKGYLSGPELAAVQARGSFLFNNNFSPLALTGLEQVNAYWQNVLAYRDTLMLRGQAMQEIATIRSLQQSMGVPPMDPMAQQLSRVSSLVRLEITPNDFETYKRNAAYTPQSAKLMSAIKAAENFYHWAKIRDGILLNNAKKAPITGPRVLVVGGFHSTGIINELKREGYSYAVVTPRITGLGQEKIYQDRMNEMTWNVSVLQFGSNPTKPQGASQPLINFAVRSLQGVPRSVAARLQGGYFNFTFLNRFVRTADKGTDSGILEKIQAPSSSYTSLQNGLGQVDIAAFERWLNGQDDAALQQIFSKDELQYAGAGEQRARRLSARYAAKITFLQAAGVADLSSVPLHEIAVERIENGQPRFIFSGTSAHRWNSSDVALSLSYNRRHEAYASVSLQNDTRVGLDAVNLSYFQAEMARNESLMHALFSQSEIDSVNGSDFARLLAVKESFLKAFGLGINSRGLRPRDINVSLNADGSAVVHLSDENRHLLGLETATIDISTNITLGVALARTVISGARPNLLGVAKTGAFKDQMLKRTVLLGHLTRGLADGRFQILGDNDAAYEELTSLRGTSPAIDNYLKALEAAGITVRVVGVTQKAYDALDNVARGDSNALSDKGNEAELKFTAMTIDPDTAEKLSIPAHGANGVLLLNAGVLRFPEAVKQGSETLLESELAHEVVHSANPVFGELSKEFIEEAAGVLQGLEVLVRVGADARKAVEKVIEPKFDELNKLHGEDPPAPPGRQLIHARTGTLTIAGFDLDILKLADVFEKDSKLYNAGEVTPEGANAVLTYVRDHNDNFANEEITPDLAGKVLTLRSAAQSQIELGKQSAGPSASVSFSVVKALQQEIDALKAQVADLLSGKTLKSSASSYPPTPARETKRRSSLNVPSLQRSAIEKAIQTHADEIVLDLNDPIADARKPEARLVAAQALADLDFQGKAVAVRLNDSADQRKLDIEQVIAAEGTKIDSVMIRASSVSSVRQIDEELAQIEQEKGWPMGRIGLQVMIDTPEGEANALDIAKSSPRVASLVASQAYAARLGRRARTREGFDTPDRAELKAVLHEIDLNQDVLKGYKQHLLKAARAAGIQLIDHVFVYAGTGEAGQALNQKLHELMQTSYESGFDGARSLHPTQTDIINRAFTPTGAEIDHLLLTAEKFLAEREKGYGGVLSALKFIDFNSLQEIFQHLDYAYRVEAFTPKRLERYWNVKWWSVYDPGVPREIPITETNLVNLIEKSVAAHPKGELHFTVRTEEQDGGTRLIGGQLNPKQLIKQANQLANALLAHGIQKGDRVSIILPNSPQFIVMFMALLKIGVIAVNLDASLPVKQLAERWNDAGIKAVFLLDGQQEKVADAARAVSSAQMAVVTRLEDMLPGKRRLPPTGAVSGVQTFELLPLLKEGSAIVPKVDVHQNDDALWQYTGGTTGTIKAARHTHKSLMHVALSAGFGLIPEGSDEQTLVSVLPFTHTYGLAVGLLVGLIRGARTIIIPNMGPATFFATVVEALRHFKATRFTAVPKVLSDLRPNISKIREELPTGIKVFSSGDILTEDVRRGYANMGIPIYHGFGQSEAPSSTRNPMGRNKLGTDGVPVPGVEFRIVDPKNTSRVLKPGQIGAIQVRGPHTMKGYANKPADTAEVVSKDGWVGTGDLGKIDKEGYLTFTGREKDLFPVGGLNVYPAQVELALQNIPGVKQIAIAGEWNEVSRDNRVVSYVIREGHTDKAAIEQAILTRAREDLPLNEVPAQIVFVKEFPINIFKKIIRSKLKDMPRDEDEDVAPSASEPALPQTWDMSRTAYVFPPAGYHFEGMGKDLVTAYDYVRDIYTQASTVLSSLLQETVDLTAISFGDAQERLNEFPLANVALLVHEIALWEVARRTYGEPAYLIGESIGEVAAYYAAGSISLEDAVALAYHNARFYEEASALTGRTMQVVKNLPITQVQEFLTQVDGTFTIDESDGNSVVSIPEAKKREFQSLVNNAGGQIMDSKAKPAHDAKLLTNATALALYEAFVNSLAGKLSTPRLKIASTRAPGEWIETPGQIIQDQIHTLRETVQWRGATQALHDVSGVRHFILFGGKSPVPFVLEHQKKTGLLSSETRNSRFSTHSDIVKVGPQAGQSLTGNPRTVTEADVKLFAKASGDRNPFHLNEAYAKAEGLPGRIGHGVLTEGFALASLSKLFPEWAIEKAAVTQFERNVFFGDTLTPVFTVTEAEEGRLALDFTVLNQHGDFLLQGSTVLVLAHTQPPVPSQSGRHLLTSVHEWAQDVQPFDVREAPVFKKGDSNEENPLKIEITQDIVNAGAALFGEANLSRDFLLGVGLIAQGSASFVPGLLLTGVELNAPSRALRIGEMVTLIARASKVQDLGGSNQKVTVEMEVRDEAGNMILTGSVIKQSPAAKKPETNIYAVQKIQNVSPASDYRMAENATINPDNFVVVEDNEDAVATTEKVATRQRMIDMIRRARRSDAPPAKTNLVWALQSHSNRQNMIDALRNPSVRSIEGLAAALEFKPSGDLNAEQVREKYLKEKLTPNKDLLERYLASMAGREALIESLGHLHFGKKLIFLRLNDPRTRWSAGDYYQVIREIGDLIDGLFLPKVRSAEDIRLIDRMLTAIELEKGWPVGSIKLEVLIEFPEAVEQVEEIAKASPRLVALLYGLVDYIAATGGNDQNNQFEYQLYAKKRAVKAAHDNGLIIIDGITPSLRYDVTKADAEKSAAMGFDGKWSIHSTHPPAIQAVQFPKHELANREHKGAAQFEDGVFDLDELAYKGENLEPLLPARQKLERPAVVIPPAMLPGQPPKAGKILEITTREEAAQAYKLAMADPGIVALVNRVAPVTDWEISGAILNAAKAAGIQAIDGVTEDNGEMKTNARHAFKMGYVSKLAASEEQMAQVAEAMTPPRGLVAEAFDIVKKYYDADMGGKGAIPYGFKYDIPEHLQDIDLNGTPIGSQRGLVDEATAKIYRDILTRARDLGMFSDMQEENYQKYVLLPVFINGERINFTKEWEFVAGSGFQKIQRQDSGAVTASRNSDGRFDLDNNVGSWLPFHNYIRWLAWLETPLVFLAAAQIQGPHFIPQYILIPFTFWALHIFANRKAMSNPAVLGLTAAKGIISLVATITGFSTGIYIAVGVLSLAHLVINNWTYIRPLKLRYVDVSNVTDTLEPMLKEIATDRKNGHAVIEVKIGRQVHLTGGGLEEAVRKSAAKYFDRAPNIYVQIVEEQGIDLRVAQLGPHGQTKMWPVPSEGLEAVEKVAIEAAEKVLDQNLGLNSQETPIDTLSIGVGGNLELAAELAERTLLYGSVEGENHQATVEEIEILKAVNVALSQKFGSQKEWIREVRLTTASTHAAGMPISVKVELDQVHPLSTEVPLTGKPMPASRVTRITARAIENTVAEMIPDLAARLPKDWIEGLRWAKDIEKEAGNFMGLTVLLKLLRNAAESAEAFRPTCQDTGQAVIFVEVGQDVAIVDGSLEAALQRAVFRGYADSRSPMRSSLVKDPLFDRTPTLNNVPAVVHTQIVPGNDLRIRVAEKGYGSENKSSQGGVRQLVESLFAGLPEQDSSYQSLVLNILQEVAGLAVTLDELQSHASVTQMMHRIVGEGSSDAAIILAGLRLFQNAGVAGWCPPGCVGLITGYNYAQAPLVAKEAMLRPFRMDKLMEDKEAILARYNALLHKYGRQSIDTRFDKHFMDKLSTDDRREFQHLRENVIALRLVQALNDIGIGPQGLGGKTAVLDVHVLIGSDDHGDIVLQMQCNKAAHGEREFVSGRLIAQEPGIDHQALLKEVEQDEETLPQQPPVMLEGPLTEQKMADLRPQLKAGTYVQYTGTILTARDAAHKRFEQALDQNRGEIPLSLYLTELRERKQAVPLDLIGRGLAKEDYSVATGINGQTEMVAADGGGLVTVPFAWYVQTLQKRGVPMRDEWIQQGWVSANGKLGVPPKTIGVPVPNILKGQIIYYVGPVPAKKGLFHKEVVGPAGPTTAMRMSQFAPRLMREAGLLGMIGKGEIPGSVIQAIHDNDRIYFIAIGGAAGVQSQAVQKTQDVTYQDLGMERVSEWTVKNFPIWVAVDADGNNIHQQGRKNFTGKGTLTPLRMAQPSRPAVPNEVLLKDPEAELPAQTVDVRWVAGITGVLWIEAAALAFYQPLAAVLVAVYSTLFVYYLGLIARGRFGKHNNDLIPALSRLPDTKNSWVLSANRGGRITAVNPLYMKGFSYEIQARNVRRQRHAFHRVIKYSPILANVLTYMVVDPYHMLLSIREDLKRLWNRRPKTWRGVLLVSIMAGFATGVQNIFPTVNEKFATYSLRQKTMTIFDLEDSLAPVRKGEGREELIKKFEDPEFVRKLKASGQSVYIRINNARSRYIARDLIEVVGHPAVLEVIDGIFLPKVETDEDPTVLQRALKTIYLRAKANGYKPRMIRVQGMVESARSVEHIYFITAVKAVVSLISGLVDYKNSMNAWDQHHQFPDSMLEKVETIASCVANGCMPVESITSSLTYFKALEEAIKALLMGFGAKWSVYMTHIKASQHAGDMSRPLEKVGEFLRLAAQRVDQPKEYDALINGHTGKIPTGVRDYLKAVQEHTHLFGKPNEERVVVEAVTQVLALLDNADDLDGNLVHKAAVLRQAAVVVTAPKVLRAAQALSPGWKQHKLRLEDYVNDPDVVEYPWDELVRKAQEDEPLILETSEDRPDRRMETGVQGVVWDVPLAEITPKIAATAKVDTVYVSITEHDTYDRIQRAVKNLRKNPSIEEIALRLTVSKDTVGLRTWVKTLANNVQGFRTIVLAGEGLNVYRVERVTHLLDRWEAETGRKHPIGLKLVISNEEQYKDAYKMTQVGDRIKRVNGIINEYSPVFDQTKIDPNGFNGDDEYHRAAIAMGRVLNAGQASLISAIQGAQSSTMRVDLQALIAAKNGYRGFVIRDLSQIEAVRKAMTPSVLLVEEMMDVAKGLHLHEGRYERAGDGSIQLKSRDKILGAFQLVSQVFFDEDKEYGGKGHDPEPVLDDKATQLMASNVLNRARELDRKMQKLNGQGYLTLEQLRDIETFANPKLSADGWEIDFSQFEPIWDSVGSDSFHRIKDRVTGKIYRLDPETGRYPIPAQVHQAPRIHLPKAATTRRKNGGWNTLGLGWKPGRTSDTNQYESNIAELAGNHSLAVHLQSSTSVAGTGVVVGSMVAGFAFMTGLPLIGTLASMITLFFALPTFSALRRRLRNSPPDAAINRGKLLEGTSA